MRSFSSSFFFGLALLGSAGAASAHVSLADTRALAGSAYRATLRIGHGCDKSSTVAVTVRIPAGFATARPVPKAGWNVTAQPGAITWTASGKESALPDGQRGEFAVEGTLPGTPGLLWFKMLQTCEQGVLDWSMVPASGLATAGLKTPAAGLEVLSSADFAQWQAQPVVEGAWMRSAVPGQSGTGAFMRLTAREPMQLVGASTPVAGSAEVHEMKMEGDVMRMRPVARLELPAGQPVELKPGGYHLMLTDLKRPVLADTSVPVTLLLRNAKGVESRLELSVPVRSLPPEGAPAAAGGAMVHRH